MSNISTIHDAIGTRLAAVLSNSKELVHSRIIEENDNLLLKRGFAFTISTGRNTQRSATKILSVARDLVVTNTIQIYGTDRSVSIKKAAEKTLLEDQYLIIKDLETDPTISEVVSRINFISDNGIEDIFRETGKFIMIQSVFEFEYFENLN